MIELRTFLPVVLFCLAPLHARAAAISWIDWNPGAVVTTTNAPLRNNGSAAGSMTFGGTTVTASYAGDLYYESETAVIFFHGHTDEIRLFGSNDPSFRHQITFSQPVTNLTMDIYSLGQAGIPITMTFFGVLNGVTSSAIPSTAFGGPTAFTGVGTNAITGEESSGYLLFTGTFDRLEFSTSGQEEYYSFALGAESVAAIPEPGSTALAAGVVAAVCGAWRRRRANR